MIYTSLEMEKKAVLDVAAKMCLAARTAPKARGTDNLLTAVLTGDDIERLAAEMERIGKESGAEFFLRDSRNMAKTIAVVLLGTRIQRFGMKPCGYCGFEGCDEAEQAGASCAFNVGDLGIAVGSAVSVAANHRADNRVMYSVGRAAMKLGMLGDDVAVAYGIPLAAGAKSPYFDR
jgi:uncharacterized ferredoxin-like protein